MIITSNNRIKSFEKDKKQEESENNNLYYFMQLFRYFIEILPIVGIFPKKYEKSRNKNCAENVDTNCNNDGNALKGKSASLYIPMPICQTFCSYLWQIIVTKELRESDLFTSCDVEDYQFNCKDNEIDFLSLIKDILLLQREGNFGKLEVIRQNLCKDEYNNLFLCINEGYDKLNEVELKILKDYLENAIHKAANASKLLIILVNFIYYVDTSKWLMEKKAQDVQSFKKLVDFCNNTNSEAKNADDYSYKQKIEFLRAKMKDIYLQPLDNIKEYENDKNIKMINVERKLFYIVQNLYNCLKERNKSTQHLDTDLKIIGNSAKNNKKYNSNIVTESSNKLSDKRDLNRIYEMYKRDILLLLFKATEEDRLNYNSEKFDFKNYYNLLLTTIF